MKKIMVVLMVVMLLITSACSGNTGAAGDASISEEQFRQVMADRGLEVSSSTSVTAEAMSQEGIQLIKSLENAGQNHNYAYAEFETEADVGKVLDMLNHEGLAFSEQEADGYRVMTLDEEQLSNAFVSSGKSMLILTGPKADIDAILREFGIIIK